MNTDFARRQMVKQQARAWDVLDEDVLTVLNDVPREQFVPAGFESLAFADTEIPIGHGQKMMTPTIEGRVLQALQLTGAENVLELGTGSGFLTACLANLSASVTSIDIYGDFLKAAEESLAGCGIDNVDLVEMDGTQQLPEGRFDAIAVTGSIQTFDPRFVDALSIGGKLFVVVGNSPAMQARLVQRTGESDSQGETLFETALSPLINGALPPQFSF